MSRAYRLLSASESTRRHVVVEDGVCTALELLEVLPAEQMREILAAELEKQGFRRDGDLAKRVDPDGVGITVDLADGSVNIRLAEEREVEASVEKTERVAVGNEEAGEKRLRERVDAALERQVGVQSDRARQQVTEKLEKKLKDLQSELDRVGNRTVAEALKAKAARIGEIQEVSEDAETGAVTIKVRT